MSLYPANVWILECERCATSLPVYASIGKNCPCLPAGWVKESQYGCVMHLCPECEAADKKPAANAGGDDHPQ